MLLEAQDIGLVYELGKEGEYCALKDVSLTVRSGEYIGVMGPSGSGKSSLLYVLAGLRKPTSGSVFYDEKDTELFTEDSLVHLRRERFGFVFQRHLLIDYLTVLENVLVPLRKVDKESRERAGEILGALGLSRLVNRKPVGLSQGQRQRIAIARALINKPEVIFADEPTASLDHTNAMEVMRCLRELSGEASLVVVTHDASILDGSDRIIELWDGRMVKGRR
ncbi:MAG: ABC transporter ATP-binding protein [Clostridia bacterium]|nr:ABC transporter ATP-binding protein [Clostridia bacterium]